jgi:hypothetical protein
MERRRIYPARLRLILPPFPHSQTVAELGGLCPLGWAELHHRLATVNSSCAYWETGSDWLGEATRASACRSSGRWLPSPAHVGREGRGREGLNASLPRSVGPEQVAHLRFVTSVDPTDARYEYAPHWWPSSQSRHLRDHGLGRLEPEVAPHPASIRGLVIDGAMSPTLHQPRQPARALPRGAGLPVGPHCGVALFQVGYAPLHFVA